MKDAKTENEVEWNKVWDDLSDEDIIKAGEESLHYSFKYNNSNLQGGVRLGKAQALNIPYAAGITHFMYNDIPCEYIQSKSGATLQVLSYIEYLEQVDPTNRHIKLYNNVKQKSFECGVDDLTDKNCRLSQILLPVGDSYVSATPTCPASFSYIFETIAKDNDYKISRESFEVGGANKFNVGRWASKRKTKRIIIHAPTESLVIKRVLSYYYHGIPLLPSRKLIYGYYRWINDVRNKPNFTKSVNKKIELQIIKNIVNDVLDRGKPVYSLLNSYIDLLEVDAVDVFHDMPLYDIMIGVIDNTVRDYEWKNKFTNYLAKEIANTKLKINDELVTLNFDDVAIASIVKMIGVSL
jgi:hypothetical protein